MKMRCYRKILCISYKDHVTDKEACAKIQQAIGPRKDLLTIVKRRKLLWCGHVCRTSGLTKTILQGTAKGEEDKVDREKGGKEWTSRNGQAWSSPSSRGQWKTEEKKMEETGCEVICGAPTTPVVKGQVKDGCYVKKVMQSMIC